MANPMMQMKSLIDSQSKLSPEELEEFGIVLGSITVSELKAAIALVKSASRKKVPMDALDSAKIEVDKKEDKDPDQLPQAIGILKSAKDR